MNWCMDYTIIYICLIVSANDLDTVNHTQTIKKRKVILENSQRKGYQNYLPVSWETCMLLNLQQLDLDTGQWSDSKSGKE